jgi:RimJ/RimL family protein N-acetyltransferase
LTTIIRTPRLELVPLKPVAIRHLLQGHRAEAEASIGATWPEEFPSAAELGNFLAIQLHRMETARSRRDWMVRMMRAIATHEVVGHCGFHGPPEVIGRAEIGYTVFTGFRGQGFAKEAAKALATWAFEHGQREVFASIAPDNAPSLAVVRALGFRQIGTQEDEVDGLELVFVLRADDPETEPRQVVKTGT